jgi:hypothetical protein
LGVPGTGSRVAVALIGAYVTRAQLRLRFQLSEAAFQQWVVDQPPVHSDITTPFHLGLYDRRPVVTSSDGYMFLRRRRRSVEHHRRDRLPTHGTASVFTDYGQDVFVHLDGPWYA